MWILLEALLACRKYALDIGEFNAENKTQYTVDSVEIKGRMDLQNSRVLFRLSKYVKRTSKMIPIDVGETIMYGDEYKDSTNMSKAIEKLIDEVWKYIGGKSAEGIQLSMIFTEGEETEA
jgi:hypothetical protein